MFIGGPAPSLQRDASAQNLTAVPFLNQAEEIEDACFKKSSILSESLDLHLEHKIEEVEEKQPAPVFESD